VLNDRFNSIIYSKTISEQKTEMYCMD